MINCINMPLKARLGATIMLESQGINENTDSRTSQYRKIQVVDSQFETFLVSVCNLATSICNVPTAMVMFTDNHTMWAQSEFESPCMLQVPRKELSCGLIIPNDNYLEIHDTNLDFSHKSRVIVTEFPMYRFYAAAPFKLPLGEVLGNICVFGKTPNTLLTYQKDLLMGLADLIAKALVIRNGSIKQIRNK